jgi:hypothetical protein
MAEPTSNCSKRRRQHAIRNLILCAYSCRYLPQEDKIVAPHTPDEMVLPIKEEEDKIRAILIALEREHGVRIHAVEQLVAGF